MPELPEVETVSRGLRPHLVHRQIVAAQATVDKLRKPVPPDLSDQCAGREITSVRRRGKYIIVRFDNKKALLLHLGMTGTFRICGADEPLGPHDRVIWILDNCTSWRLSDPRRFGSVEICDSPAPDADPPQLMHLGPEPLGPDFTADYLYKMTRHRTRPVKNLIMDQEIVTGIGNIYAAEALFLAGIRPQKQSRRLSRKDCARLVETSRCVLARAIDIGGTTISNYRQVDGSEGKFHLELNVYGNADQPCRICGHTVKKVVQAGRSSFYCPKCQK